MNTEILILKKNIRNLMDNHNPKVTQSEMGEITGASQPQMSKYLSDKDNSFFRVDQLIAIANYFEVSIDSLLGRDLSIIQNLTGSMSDFISVLFELDEYADLEIKESKNTALECDQCFEAESEVKPTYSLSFHIEYLNDFLSEWKEIRNITRGKNKPIYKQIYESWKKSKLEESTTKFIDGSERPDEYFF